MIGMLLYVCTNTRPDIAASVCILSQKVVNPTSTDLNEVKRIVRYLKGTQNYKLVLGKNLEGQLHMYSDANWAEDRTDRKSNSGHIGFFRGGAISWACRKQGCVAVSSCEAEYMALNDTAQESIWLNRVIKSFEAENQEPVKIYADNQSSIHLVDKHRYSIKSKHIDTKYHCIQDWKEKGLIDIEYVPTEHNVADMLTKPLGRIKLERFRRLAAMENQRSEEKHFRRSDEVEEECWNVQYGTTSSHLKMSHTQIGNTPNLHMCVTDEM
jgi:hypothetical protein